MKRSIQIFILLFIFASISSAQTSQNNTTKVDQTKTELNKNRQNKAGKNASKSIYKIPAKLPDKITEGSLITTAPDGTIVEFPLKHTEVTGDVSGFIAKVKVTHIFQNPYSEPCEAMYVFPLPNNSAVFYMEMKIGNRTIKGQIKKRADAKMIYEKARQQGKIASLLEQERPNIFTQSVANIMPGQEIQVSIQYVEDLKYEEGSYEFVFPMVVGPRYIPGVPVSHNGTGWSPDTDEVNDASRITPPVIPPGMRSGHDISVSLTINAGVPIKAINSKSHDVEIQKLSPDKVSLKLKNSDSIPNKDLIVNYQVTGDKVASAFMTHASEIGRYFMLIIQPKEEYISDEVTPKELIFVIDESGSMSGYPIETSKAAMRYALKNLNKKDTFQIVRFSTTAQTLAPAPLENNSENILKGLSFIESMGNGGGTEMLNGILTAMSQPHDSSRLRIILLLTDGYVGNETTIIGAIEKNLGNARFFSLGIGTSVNRYLLDEISKVGRGETQYVLTQEDPQKVISNFYKRISNPFLTDIDIDWNGLNVDEVYPEKIPDLFSARPVIIFGKYSKTGSGTIKLRGKIAGKTSITELKVDLPEKEEANYTISNLWARKKIDNLMAKQNNGEKADIIEQVTQLALKHSLVSKYTSFVAVEQRTIANKTGKLKTVTVPVEMPHDVSYEGVFGQKSSSSVSYPMSMMSGSQGYGGIGVGHGYGKGSGSLGVIYRSKVNSSTDTSVTGGLATSSIHTVIKQHLNKIRACYRQQLTKNSTLSGRIVVRFTIEPSGIISKISIDRVQTTLNDSDVEDCIIRVLKKVTFTPVSPGSIKINIVYPFVFNP